MGHPVPGSGRLRPVAGAPAGERSLLLLPVILLSLFSLLLPSGATTAAADDAARRGRRWASRRAGNGARYGRQRQARAPGPPPQNELEEPPRQTDSFERPVTGGHFVTGMCANDPCPADKDCCCWSTAGTQEHPDYPNDSAAEANRTCGADTPEMLAHEMVLRPDCFLNPGGCGDTGVYAELKGAGMPVYEDRELCCVQDKDDVEVQSQMSPEDEVPTTPAPPPWKPEPTVPPPVKTAFDYFAEDDLAAADMEVSAKNYAAAADSVQSAAADLKDTGKSMEQLFESTKSKRETAARLRGAMGDFAAGTAAAVNKFEADIRARVPGVLP